MGSRLMRSYWYISKGRQILSKKEMDLVIGTGNKPNRFLWTIVIIIKHSTQRIYTCVQVLNGCYSSSLPDFIFLYLICPFLESWQSLCQKQLEPSWWLSIFSSRKGSEFSHSFEPSIFSITNSCFFYFFQLSIIIIKKTQHLYR